MGRRKELKSFVALLKKARGDLRAVIAAAEKYDVTLRAALKRAMRKGTDKDQAAKSAKSKRAKA